MKTAYILSLITLFSIIHTSYLRLCAATPEKPSPVLDINGKNVQAGVDYYILPVIRGRGGGLTLASVGNETCPLKVVQEQLEVDSGLPLIFRPVNPKKGVVRVSTDHNIVFSASSICVQSMVWKLDLNESSSQYLIAANGVQGNPGRETISNWFKIEEYESDYKIVFCPTVCSFCRVICGDVVVSVQDGKRVLSLSLTRDNAPFRVMFRKA